MFSKDFVIEILAFSGTFLFCFLVLEFGLWSFLGGVLAAGLIRTIFQNNNNNDD